MKQEIIADLSRITEEEQAILDGKTEVEKERYSSEIGRASCRERV